jgi:hypothetical protein
VGQPSSKTDYVILGDNAGPSEVAALKKHNLKTLSEDEFLDLIATRKGPGNGKGLSEKEKKKKDKEEKAIRDSAKEMEAREKAVKAAGSSCVALGCARMLFLGIKLILQQGQGHRPQGAALDRSICPADSQGDLRQQGASREAPTMAQRLVNSTSHIPSCRAS